MHALAPAIPPNLPWQGVHWKTSAYAHHSSKSSYQGSHGMKNARTPLTLTYFSFRHPTTKSPVRSVPACTYFSSSYITRVSTMQSNLAPAPPLSSSHSHQGSTGVQHIRTHQTNPTSIPTSMQEHLLQGIPQPVPFLSPFSYPSGPSTEYSGTLSSLSTPALTIPPG